VPPEHARHKATLPRLTRRKDGSRTGQPVDGGRYGLLLAVLVGTYLLSAFNGKDLTTEAQTLLFAVVLLLGLRSSPLPRPWPKVIGVLTVAGSGVAFGVSLTGGPVAAGAAELWKALMLLMTAVLVVRRVLAWPAVTIQSIYGALSAYLITGLMFAACFSAIEHLGGSAFFAGHQPANTQTFQYFSFTTLTTLGYGDFTAAGSGGRAVAVIEALTGQVFLATLVARLVAAYRGGTGEPGSPPSPSAPQPAGDGRNGQRTMRRVSRRRPSSRPAGRPDQPPPGSG
jgi:hypothetical protein